jgi:hypothetical protein
MPLSNRATASGDGPATSGGTGVTVATFEIGDREAGFEAVC